MRRLLLIPVLLLAATLARAQAVIVDSIGNCSSSQGIPVFDSVSGYYKCSPIVNANSDTRLISGGAVSYSGAGLVYDVQAATYMIAGNLYSSPQTQVTLTAADGSNPRIDLLVFTTSSVADKITGTAATPAVAPSVDPTSQLYTGWFAYVATSATVPTNVYLTNIYLENTEWTCSEVSPVGAFNCASTSNPYAGTKDVEATAVGAGDYVQFVNSSTITIPSTAVLSLFDRSKAKWSGQRSLTFQYLNGSTNVGNGVTFNEGAYGWNSSTTGSYQLIVIPISRFALTGVVDTLRITVSGGGASTIGFYLDNITLQTAPGEISPPTGDYAINTPRKRWSIIYTRGAGIGTHSMGDDTDGGENTNVPDASHAFPYVNYNSPGGNNNHDGNLIYIVYTNPHFYWIDRPDNVTAVVRYWISATDQTSTTMVSSDNPAGNYAGFRGSTVTGDTTWKCITKDNVTQNVQSTGIPFTVARHLFEIKFNGGSSVDFFIDNVKVCTSVAHLPATTVVLRYQDGLLSGDATERNLSNELVFVTTDSGY